MSRKSKDPDGKPGWESALREYQETFLREMGGIGFPVHDWPEEKRIDDAPAASESITKARWAFRTIMTFCKQKLVASGPVLVAGEEKPTRGWVKFEPRRQEEVEAGKSLIGTFILAFAHGDDDFFYELIRLRKRFMESSLTDINAMTSKTALFLIARSLLDELGTNPTREQVLDRLYQTTTHRPSDTSKLFREAKLEFLKDNRGRPRKTRKPGE